MGLFTNNKKLCPICGNPTPRLLASAVEGQNLCKECAAKIDLPDGVLNSMTLDEFREYINCYDANKPLRDSFTETYRYDFGFFKGSLLLDMDHQLLRLGVVDTAFALEPSDIKSFRILEDGEVLYEGEKGNFRSCKSDIGQIGTYINIVDDIVKMDSDGKTIGLIICKEKNNVLAKYAVNSSNKPIAISAYELSNFLPENLATLLPSTDELESRLLLDEAVNENDNNNQ